MNAVASFLIGWAMKKAVAGVFNYYYDLYQP